MLVPAWESASASHTATAFPSQAIANPSPPATPAAAEMVRAHRHICGLVAFYNDSGYPPLVVMASKTSAATNKPALTFCATAFWSTCFLWRIPCPIPKTSPGRATPNSFLCRTLKYHREYTRKQPEDTFYWKMLAWTKEEQNHKSTHLHVLVTFW